MDVLLFAGPAMTSVPHQRWQQIEPDELKDMQPTPCNYSYFSIKCNISFDWRSNKLQNVSFKVGFCFVCLFVWRRLADLHTHKHTHTRKCLEKPLSRMEMQTSPT